MPHYTQKLGVIVIMGLFSLLFGCKEGDNGSNGNSRYVTEQSFHENLAKQTAMSLQVVERLREYGVTDDAKLKLEFFFYTDTERKAQALAGALRNLGYKVEAGPSAGDDKVLLVTGWTVPIKMDDSSVVAWDERMIRLGYNHDCEFDGWDTEIPSNEP